MHSLGISVYPDKSDIKEVYEYMETAAKLGFSRIFTCFSIPARPVPAAIASSWHPN